MMRSIGRVVVLLMLGGAAWADQFQLKESKDGDVFDVSFATVKLEDGSELGMTDKYGRVMVNDLPAGEYQAQVVQGTEERTVTLRVDGAHGLKVVYLE
jgi:hypothetical protein